MSNDTVDSPGRSSDRKNIGEGYLVPSWIVRVMLPIIIVGGTGWLTKVYADVNELKTRIIVQETRKADVYRRLERIERLLDGISTSQHEMQAEQKRLRAKE